MSTPQLLCVDATFEECADFPEKAIGQSSTENMILSIHDSLKIASDMVITDNAKICKGDVCVPNGQIKATNIQTGTFETFFVEPISNATTCVLEYEILTDYFSPEPKEFFDENYAFTVLDPLTPVSEVFTLDCRFLASVDTQLSPPGLVVYNTALRYPRSGIPSLTPGLQLYTINFEDSKPAVPGALGNFDWDLNGYQPNGFGNPVPFSISFDGTGVNWTVDLKLNDGQSNSVSFQTVIPPAGIPLPAGVPGLDYVPPYNPVDAPGSTLDALPVTQKLPNQVYLRFLSPPNPPGSLIPGAFVLIENLKVTSNTAPISIQETFINPGFAFDVYHRISNLGDQWEISGELSFNKNGLEPTFAGLKFYFVHNPEINCAASDTPQPTLDSISLRRTCGVGTSLVPSVITQTEVNPLWKQAFALQNYGDTESAKVFTIPVEIEFEREFPRCPTVVTSIYSSSKEITLDVQAAPPNIPVDLKAVVVSVVPIVDQVTTKGFVCRIHVSIVGNNKEAVQTLFKELVSNGRSNLFGGIISIETLKDTTKFIKFIYHAHA